MDDLFDVFEDQPAAGGNANSNNDASSNGKAKTEIESSPSHPSAAAKPSKSKKKNKKRKAVELANGGESTRSAPEATEVEMADAAPASPEEDVADADGAADGDDTVMTDEQDSKRRRKDGATEAPVMTDSFETAESRELAAAAGFAPADESNLVLKHNIQHQVALPPDLDYEYVPLSQHKAPKEPARTWPFTLDPFQRLSISSIERDESVLVSAHTSAGKTVVAEYAIAHCLKQNTRVIYTSPIKALSNQKYREFNEAFGDVGLMTGDVTINPTASCLVMTTEILRSMLYRGSEIMREVAWVVFDEIHYMRDKSRGVVWEETIILLPDKVRYVFLSATIPNAFQFADGIFLVVDEKGVFRENNFNRTMQMIQDKKGEDLKEAGAKSSGKGKHKKPMKGGKDETNADIQKIVKMIMNKNFNPVIVFNFSKRECEMMALFVSKFSFNDDSEKQMVRKVFTSAIESLSEEDRDLPQISNLLPLLEKGIGVHHSGLLPILKETIEILFQEGLIKVLFATETFSIGLNMPAKTVVFTQVTKWDGVQRRPLTSSEYIQMSGRAGRRGLDERGIVIMMVDDKLEPETAKEIVAGSQDRLNSAFHLGYNMVLNLLRIEAISPEFMLENCFFQFQNSASVAGLEQDLMSLQKEKDGMVIPDEATIKDYYSLRHQIEAYTKDMIHVIQHPTHCLDYLQPGRIIQIQNPKTGQDFGWGVVVNFIPRKAPKFGEKEYEPQESYFVDVYLRLDPNSESFAPASQTSQPSKEMPDGLIARGDSSSCKFEVVPCLFTCIKTISQIRVFMPKDVKTREDIEEVRSQLMKSLTEKLLRKIEVLEARLLANPLHGSPLLPGLWEQYSRKIQLTDQTKAIKKKIGKAHSIAQLDELKSRKRVLRRLDFINDADVVQMKARVACEISSTEGHELLLSELLFDRFFNELTPEMCAAILSVFIFEEKVEAATLRDELQKPYSQVQAKARIIAKISQESKLEVNEDEYVQSLKWQLMETVYAWSNGKPFSEICKMTNAYEGSLIRLFRRLEELLRQMAQAGKVMGSEELTTKFEESLAKIRRDIVAAQSLYL
ncbi:hypothetical protein PG985_008234 [Apiospora marii]|uniref:uncharacterized protein n=1 Tax=Apiospora marii TaxID=335849 RepID=UPI00312F41A2